MSNLAIRGNLRHCVSIRDLEALFDEAFAHWQPNTREPNGHRKAPRIPSKLRKKMFVVSYAHQGREFVVNQTAKIIDVSAEGMGLLLPDSIPAGSLVCFSFHNDDHRTFYGTAFCVRSHEDRCGYRIGLTFPDAAGELDEEGGFDAAHIPTQSPSLSVVIGKLRGRLTSFVSSCCNRNSWIVFGQAMVRRWSNFTTACRNVPCWWNGQFSGIVRNVGALFHVETYRLALEKLWQSAWWMCSVLRAQPAGIRSITTDVCGKPVRLDIQARLFRYAATIHVDGRPVATGRGKLNHRIGNLFSPNALPTLVHIDTGTLSGWAVVRPNIVIDAWVDISIPMKQELGSRLRRELQTAPIPAERPVTRRSGKNKNRRMPAAV